MCGKYYLAVTGYNLERFAVEMDNLQHLVDTHLVLVFDQSLMESLSV